MIERKPSGSERHDGDGERREQLLFGSGPGEIGRRGFEGGCAVSKTSNSFDNEFRTQCTCPLDMQSSSREIQARKGDAREAADRVLDLAETAAAVRASHKDFQRPAAVAIMHKGRRILRQKRLAGGRKAAWVACGC